MLLFPPFSWALSTDIDTVLTHHRIANAEARLPMMLYQAGVPTGGMAYTPQMLTALVGLPDVGALQAGRWETPPYQAHRRLLKPVAPQLAGLAAGAQHPGTLLRL